jgi:hypothetical protein
MDEVKEGRMEERKNGEMNELSRMETKCWWSA